MPWPNFFKFKMPKWNLGLRVPHFLQPSVSFYSAWKRFIKQIPTESRSLIKNYQHFIVLGQKSSGKTDLVEGLIEHSQDLYPFDTVSKENPDLQFYLGPQQVIQEMSFSALENRSIKVRRHVIKLWKKLYAKQEPIVIVTCNCFDQTISDLKELGKYAQLVAGKISLLTEIRQAPIKVRVVLTHLDRIPGYLEFARFLKQQNISFSITLSSEFESNTLADQLRKFSEENHSLLLTTVSDKEYVKIFEFFKQLPLVFPALEEFLRNLVARVSFKESIILDSLFMTSNQESSTSFRPFYWIKLPSRAIFFRYPLLKHQLAAATIYLISSSFLFFSYFNTHHTISQFEKGIELLDLFQFTAFEEDVVPEITTLIQPKISHYPLFFAHKQAAMKELLASRIWKHAIEPVFRKSALENKGEFKHLYFLALMQASSNKNLKKFISNNSAHWAERTNIDERLIKIYVAFCSGLTVPSDLHLGKVNPFLPLASLNPWSAFFKQFQEAIEQPLIVDRHFNDIMNDVDKFLSAISRMRKDPIVFSIASLIEDKQRTHNDETIPTLQWIGENIDALENFFSFLRYTSIPPLEVQGMNLSQFFVKVKDIARLSELDAQVYNFALPQHVFTFDTAQWVKLVLAYDIEQAIQNYISLNADSDGSIFFQNTFESPATPFNLTEDSFPFFNVSVVIPGRYSRADYEKKVRSTAEKLAVLVESLPINIEEKKRFANFLVKESIGYIKSYQDKYIKFFESCDVKGRSIENLKKILTNLTQSSANFYEFLKSVQHQTSIFSDPFLSIKNMEELNEFSFLNKILNQKDGPAPIAMYQKLLEELLLELETDPKNLPNENFEVLAPYLTPAGRISLNICHYNPASFLVRAKETLHTMGVPGKFQDTFLKPILYLHYLGLEELKNSVENLWTSELATKLESLLSQFPFNPHGEEVATLETVEQFFHPSSASHQMLTQIMKACSREHNGSWESIDPEHLQLDPKLCKQFNQVSKVSKTLWDSTGNPKPFMFRVKSVPFPSSLEKDLFPVLSYLVIGGHSVYNLNQDPSWQTLKIEWWKEDVSSAGVELMNKQTKSKSYLTTQTPTVPWSFFTLLKQAKQGLEGTWTWDLPAKDGKTIKQVSFCFETNPATILEPHKNI
jgi:hypothetical protein